MIRTLAIVVAACSLFLCSCSKKETAESPKPGAETATAASPAGGPRASVVLKDGSKVPGTVVASSPAELVVAGDDGIERKIPMSQVKSVEYGDVQAAQPAKSQPAPPRQSANAARQAANAPPQAVSAPLQAVSAPPPPTVTTRTYELPVGSEVSVRTNEVIDSSLAVEGQTFDAQVTRDAKDANGDVVIPRGSPVRMTIKSASKGGQFRGASDLVLDLQTVMIKGSPYAINTADIAQKGKQGVGANKRTAEFTGGGAALGAIIGAVAGGGKGAAIGAGAGAGAGVLTQILTKGGAIKVPAESVLTFQLDKPLRVTAAQ